MARSISNATLLRSNPETHVDPQSHLKQHEAVARLAQLALAGESMERLVYKTASLVASALDAEFVRVLEYDANEQILRLRAGVGWREPLIGSAVIKVSEDPQAGFALNARSYVIVDDIRLDARSCRCNLLLEHEVVSGVSVPIALDGKAVGVLSAHSRLPGRFTTQDASFLRSMAEVLSAAMSRSKADCALRESEALFKGVFNSDLVGIIFWTSDGAITEANDAFLKMTGYDRCDLREGKITWPGLSPAGKALPDELCLQAIARVSVAAAFEREIVCKDGMRLPVLLGSSGLNGSVGRGVCFVVHISERKRDQEEIRRQIERLTALRSIDIAITASLELRTTLGVVLEEVMRQLDVDAAQILVLKPDGQTLESAAACGFRDPAQTDKDIHIAVSLAGKVVRERKSVHIPILPEHSDRLFAEHLGQHEGFATYHGVPLIANGEVKGVLEVFQRTPSSQRKDWMGFLETLAGQAAIAIDNASMYEEIQRSNRELTAAYETTLEGWSRALDMRDHETQGHTKRVTEVTVDLARALGIDDEALVHIRRGCLLHDIGKMGIPDGILLKPGPLTADERRLMEMHTVYAQELLSPIPFLQPALDIPASHHEKWDGSGYPLGLKGEDIPMAARIFAVVDVWDALSQDRPYRRAWKPDQVREYIAQNSGAHFDPRVAEVFLSLGPENLAREHLEQTTNP